MATQEIDMVGQEVLVERDGAVLIVTINRPEARNACNLAVAEGVGDALELAATNRSVPGRTSRL